MKENRPMVVLVKFDMPTKTRGDMKNYRDFRNGILGLGFIMFQYSVYIRYCQNITTSLKYENLIQRMCPPKSSIRILKVTEKQYENMKIVENYREKPEILITKQAQTRMVF